MPVTVRGTDILFNDGSTQSTAAGAVTTTAVLNATAGASVGAVGTYAFFVDSSQGGSGSRSPGATLAGSSLRYSNAYADFGSTSTGTWRLMGQITGNQAWVSSTTLWLRIS